MQRSTLNLIDELARAEAALQGQLFLTPLVGRARARLRVRGLIYELHVERMRPGWWQCRALDARRASIVEEAAPWLRGAYLALWPALRLLLVERLRGDDWIALPFNGADAEQRFRMRGPQVLRLVEGGQPFERVIGRVEGGNIWYDVHDRRASPATAEALRAALSSGMPAPPIAGVAASERGAYALLAGKRAESEAAKAAAQTERRLQDALAIGGARLVGYAQSGDELRVTWERDGLRSVTLVGAGLDVIAAGICLSDEDQRFDLTSIVNVVADAPDFARYE